MQNRFKLSIFKLLIFTIFTQGLLMSATLKNIKYNGTEVPIIFEKHKTLPIFNLQLIFKNSGYINDMQTPGLTSLTASVLNEGTKKDGAIKFARKLENKAISISTNTGFETFVIEISCLKSEYKNALNYLNEILQDPNLNNKTLNKLKTLKISKLKQKENDFDYVASKTLKAITYPNTPLQYTSTGTIKSIETISIKDIKSKIDQVLNINNLIIAVGGDIKVKEFKDDIKPVLKNLGKKETQNIKKIDITKDIKEKIVKKETQQSYIYFASPFNIKVNSKDNYKMKVASFILGGSGFGSRLMEEIRVKHGLAYSAYGYMTNKKSHSHFTGYLQTKLENTKKAKNMVIDIVNEFVKNGITKDELEAAKNFLLGSEPLRSETFSQRLNRAFMLYYKGLDFDYPKNELEMIKNLTLEELNEFIKSHNEIKNLSFSIITK
jgi:predicted Zn-dependent peptidase